MKKSILYLFFILFVSILLLTATGCSEAPVTVSLESETEAASTEPEDAAKTEESIIPGLELTPQSPREPLTFQEVTADISTLVDSLITNLNERTLQDWAFLGINILIVGLIYLLGKSIVRRLLKVFARRTKSSYDDDLVEIILPQIYWILVAISIQFFLGQLVFLSETAWAWVNSFFFILYLSLSFTIGWKMIDYTLAWYSREIAAEEDPSKFDQLNPLVHRAAKIVLVIVAVSILLDHFGINITALAAALGIGGLALSLAAQDTLADMISGIVIYLDQPFRIGDRIEIQGLGTWGDVVEIGTRTTRIRTRDNRLVIVPNSVIGDSQVVNYSYPDPQYRIQSDIEIAYGMDLDKIREVITKAVREVPGILSDKPVDVLYIEMGEWAMVIRVRWWIESYEDTRRIYDRVHTAIQHAIDEAGIDSPYPTHNTNFKIEPAEVDKLRRAFKDR